MIFAISNGSTTVTRYIKIVTDRPKILKMIKGMRIFRVLYSEQTVITMKKTLFLASGIFLLSQAVSAQEHNHNHKFDPQNAREGENVEYCFTHKKLNELLQDPEWAERIQMTEEIRAQEAQNGVAAPKATTYYIPVVFHLLHNNGIEKISDDQIYDAFEILNRDYDLQNADAANVVNAFNASNPSAIATPTDVDIQFRLATKAPNGTCFSGITHTVSSQTNSGNGQQQANAVKNNNDVYQGNWPGDEYLNIFICGDIGGAAGYTYNPIFGFDEMENGIWVLHNYTGSIGTSSTYTSRTLTHEVGHWLNLSHPWGGNNNPGVSCGTDNVNDTPATIGLTSCNLTANTCDADNAFWGFDQIDNTENYMDYSYCSKMFTPGQVTRMRNAITSGVAGRSNVISASNLVNTGADGNLYLCDAEFTADKTTICVGESIQFEDLSFNAVNGWTWTFNGGSPGTSGDQDPLVTYNTPGLYEVQLQATDGSTNDTETKTAYIRVLPNAGGIPFHEGFEAYSTLTNIEQWGVINSGNNAAFEIETSTGHSGSKCAKLGNYGQVAGNTDELESSTLDLSSVTSATGVTMSFRFAYRKRSTNNDEYLKVFISKDCGDTWVQRKTIFGDQLSPDVVTSAWTPSSITDWTTVHMTNVTSSYWVNNFRYKFTFESDGGNNFYLDDINIYPGDPSDQIVVGLEEFGQVENLSLYPNPADAELNVSFTVSNAQSITFEIIDITGKTIQANQINATEGSNLVMLNTNSLASGMYLLNIKSGDQIKTMQFVVK